jgi:hypothetical protein
MRQVRQSCFGFLSVREGDPQKDKKDDKEDHICDRSKAQQHRVSFHLVSFVAILLPGGSALAARRLSFVRHSLLGPPNAATAVSRRLVSERTEAIGGDFFKSVRKGSLFC